ncbi:restriction endonuclease subunit S [Pseudomonas neustonica]|uniref:restriction endonuclease subunit S n=1 Tax=Pseudomonas neustonica TaxID=2487346 RepID=UPI003F458E1C
MTWKNVRLAECCEIKPPKAEAKKTLKESDLVSFVPMNNLGIDTPNLALEEDKALSEVTGSYTYFAENDVLLAKITPCFENGKLGIAKGLTNGVGFGSSEFIVFRTSDQLVPEYLYYYLLRPSFREQGQAVMTGAVGHKRVPKEFIEDTEIPLPLVEEQKRIVTILDQAFADIDKARALTEQNLKNARELFESYLQQVFDSLGSECDLKSMSDETMLSMIDGDRGKNYPKKSDFLENGYCLFLSTKNVRPDGFLFDETMFIDKSSDNLLRKGRLKRNDVVITTRGTIGNLALYDDSVEFEHIRINSGMLILRPNIKTIHPCYLFEIMRSGIVKRQIEQKISGAAQPQLPVKTLNSFVFPVPKTLEKQKSVVNKIRAIESQINKSIDLYTQKLVRLEELKKSILHKAFSGDLTNNIEEAAAQ